MENSNPVRKDIAMQAVPNLVKLVVTFAVEISAQGATFLLLDSGVLLDAVFCTGTNK